MYFSFPSSHHLHLYLYEYMHIYMYEHLHEHVYAYMYIHIDEDTDEDIYEDEYDDEDVHEDIYVYEYVYEDIYEDVDIHEYEDTEEEVKEGSGEKAGSFFYLVPALMSAASFYLFLRMEFSIMRHVDAKNLSASFYVMKKPSGKILYLFLRMDFFIMRHVEDEKSIRKKGIEKETGEPYFLSSLSIFFLTLKKEGKKGVRKRMYECFHCGCRTVIWDSDFDTEDYGYEPGGIVHVCHCSSCGAEILYIIHGAEEESETDG